MSYVILKYTWKAEELSALFDWSHFVSDKLTQSELTRQEYVHRLQILRCYQVFHDLVSGHLHLFRV